MDLNIKSLRCFVAIAEHGSFTAAAQRMHLTQPSLSAHIRTLEQSIGLALFNRTTRRVELTAAGEALLPTARQMTEANDRLVRAGKLLARTDHRQLLIGSTVYASDVEQRNELIEEFCKRYPEIKVIVDSHLQMDLMDALESGNLDVCLLLATRISRAEYDSLVSRKLTSETLYPDDLPAIVIQQERVQLQIPLASPLAQYDEIPALALAGQKVVGLSNNTMGAPLEQSINNLLTEAGAELVESPDPTGAGIERYGRQMGIVAVSVGWMHETSALAKDTVRRPLAGLTTCIDLVLVTHPKPVSEPASLFWDLVQLAVQAGRFSVR